MEYKNAYRKIERRYIVAAIILVLLFVSRQFIIQYQISSEKYMSAIINISGRQRMLSQKISKDILMIYQNEKSDISYYLKDLEESLAMFEEAHYNLSNATTQEGEKFDNSQAVKNIYIEMEPHFKRILESGENVLDIAKQGNYDDTLILEEIRIIAIEERIFLEKMDQIVDQYDYESKNRISRMEKTELILFFFLLLSTAFITIFVFIPASKSLRQSFIDISEKNESIIKIFNSMKGALFLVKEDGDIVRLNSDARKLIENDKKDSSILNIRRHVKWLDFDISNVLDRAKSGEKIENLEARIQDQEGEILFITVSIILGRYNRKNVILISAYDISIQKKAEQVLREISTKDELTGLYNRRFLESIIDSEIERANRYKFPISVAILDIDDFKMINDKWGHPVGDLVLRELARILTANLRESDYLIRLGGEEFVVLMPHTSLENSLIVTEKLRKAIENNVNNIVGQYTISIGVAEMIAGESYDQAYNRMDNALYKAKKSGKNCVVESIGIDELTYNY